MRKSTEYGTMKIAGIFIGLMLVFTSVSLLSYISLDKNQNSREYTFEDDNGQTASFLMGGSKRYQCNHCCLNQYRACREWGGCTSPTWIADCTHECYTYDTPTDCGETNAN
jgi:hypothetical protein